MLGAPLRLRCEYLSNPLGIDATRPRLSWWVNDPRPAEVQTGYHVLAASRLELLAAGGDLWDSGRVESQQTLNVEYRGRPLCAGQRVWWKVRTFDSDGLPSDWSEPGFFEMGLLAPEDWRAQWISTPLRGSPATPVQVPVLRRSFQVPDAVVAARLHITALGTYRAELNGQAVSEDRLTPGWTDYRKRLRYQTYDVTALLQTGDNAIGVLLGDGWYCGRPGAGRRQQYGQQPQLFAQINLTLASGALLLICTDQQWKWQPSWILQSDLIQGESVDARQRQPGWSAPGLDESGWSPVVVKESPGVRPSATMSPPMRTSRELQGVKIAALCAGPPGRGRWVYDFGEPVVGCVRVRMRAAESAQLKIRFAGSVDPAGEPLALDAGVDWYTAAGDASGESFETQFALHGFRYAEIETDLPTGPPSEVVAIAAGTDLEPTGGFICDHRQLNDLFAGLHRTQRLQALDFPAAGIGSDSRLGVLGAVRGGLTSAMLNHDVAAFYSKWLDDLSDAQLDDGALPTVVPVPPHMAGAQADPEIGWSDAFVNCAWTQYRYFGNHRALTHHYPGLRRLVGAFVARWPDFVCEPGPRPLASAENGIPADLATTAWFFQTARLAARIAGVLGKLGDLERFEELAQSIRLAFRGRFVTRDGHMVDDSAAACVLALHLGLLERAEHRAAFDTVVRRVETGNADLRATPWLLQVLTRGGRVDLAYEMLLGPAVKDLEAVWHAPGAELARVALGSVAEWLYTSMAGIDLDGDLSESRNAFRRVRIQPHPPLGAGAVADGLGPPIRTASASLDTVNGHFESGWEITDAGFELNVLVPCNCSALVVMPDATEHNLAAGRHRLQMPFVDASDGIPILREVSEAS